ncbi:hypothetical protein LTR48_006014 [Friedmanniomyces endolithicus]|uniref:Uncharacterized protein n=1 Tax=Rachicladosporium monterosium TaxID=1507873 RepID=A0ABR0KXV1_9PEZI|nr:hypothetical protein LTR48_006014 [Friedmanniomyces endolithicus]KAK5140394.1 hypothetical protein LTR32_006791 [Rachicladosporium monterosium]
MTKEDLVIITSATLNEDAGASSDATGLPDKPSYQYHGTKEQRKASFWQDGIGLAVTDIKTGKKFWLCRHCYDNPVPQPLVLVETDSNTPAVPHRQSRHNYDPKGERHETPTQKRKRDSEDIGDAIKRLRDEKEQAFDMAAGGVLICDGSFGTTRRYEAQPRRS